MIRRPPAGSRNSGRAAPKAKEKPGASHPIGAGGGRGEPAGLAARRVSAEILIRVETHGAFADVLLGHRLPDFAPADRRLITRLTLGVLAWRMRLDYELTQYCTQPLEKLEPAVAAALRLGLFQMRHLNRIPVHAAVDTAVTLAREAAGRGAGGLVNAVLRRAAKAAAAMPDRGADEIGYLAISYSHPRWLVTNFIEWFGMPRAEALMAANNEAAPNAVRLNLARGTRDEIVARMAVDGIAIRPGARLPETALLEAAPDFDCAAYRAGLFHPQSEGSQLVARMLAPAPGTIVIDCAAAPGGKTSHLAELVDARGRVIAFDLNLQGLKAARDVARRLGHDNIAFVNADMAVAPPMRAESAGSVLLDAPCTGTGTLRQHPELRLRLRPGDFERMAGLQSEMLHRAAALVRPQGVIVYAVCSISPQEGAGVVRGFLRDRAEFTLERPPVPELAPFIQHDGSMAIGPESSGLDGFYAARMRRR